MARPWFILLLLLCHLVCYGQVAGDAATVRLQQAIIKYKAIAEANRWHILPDTLTLQAGQPSSFVPWLQQNLLLTGDLQADSTSSGLLYTTALTAAVRHFQQRHGLKPDGIMGPITLKAMNVPPLQRLLQLQLNLYRWDTTAQNLPPTYVLVNIPDYTMQVIDSSSTVMRMRLVVGKAITPTLPLRSTLNMVVLQPYWYLPRSIAVEEIVPILRRNPGYLSRKNMVLEQLNAAGKYARINPWRINWKNIDSHHFDFRIVQLNGSQNELGQVKFLFENQIAQYMHDTPAKKLFNSDARAFSHGCIRLEQPMQFADYLLANNSGRTQAAVKKLKASRKPNHYIQLKKPLPLLIVYLTAWADEHMQVQFREDVYGWDHLTQLVQEN